MLKKFFYIFFLGIVLLILISCSDLNKKITYSVDKAKCNGCGYCVNNCPENAISIVNNKAVIDINKCTGCGQCALICPQDAIR